MSWECPNCGNVNEGFTCLRCGFENSLNYEAYRTVAELPQYEPGMEEMNVLPDDEEDSANSEPPVIEENGGESDFENGNNRGIINVIKNSFNPLFVLGFISVVLSVISLFLPIFRLDAHTEISFIQMIDVETPIQEVGLFSLGFIMIGVFLFTLGICADMKGLTVVGSTLLFAGCLWWILVKIALNELSGNIELAQGFYVLLLGSLGCVITASLMKTNRENSEVHLSDTKNGS